MKCDFILDAAVTGIQEVYVSHLLGDYNLEHNPHEQLYVVITIKKNTRVNVIDDLHTHLFLNTKLEFLVQEDARLTYEVRMLEGIDVIFGNSQKSEYADTTVIAKELIVRMVGIGAQANIIGTCFGHEKRIFRFKTLQDHQAPRATSNVMIKSVLDDQALFSCQSLITVAQEAQGTSAQQSNKNILLSNQARATSIPMLEVLANDVTCKHGAAISTLNEQQLFYAQSRGFSMKAAKKLLVQAFLGY